MQVCEDLLTGVSEELKGPASGSAGSRVSVQIQQLSSAFSTLASFPGRLVQAVTGLAQ